MKPKGHATLAPERSRTKTWIFRLLGLVVLPLGLLAGAEAGLRLAGYGYSTSYFKPARIGGVDYLVENDKFGLRFFPPEVARSPPPLIMEAKKPPGLFRIFVLGESAALGDPRPAYGAARYLQTLLRERYPAAKFEVICGAVTAIDSHAILPIARECARHQGDFWIVYMGNNEMIGPFGATTVFGSQSPSLGYVRFILALQETRVGQWLMSVGRKLAGAAHHGTAWGGMKMFLENQVAPGDRRREVVYASFQRNLEDILAVARHSSVPVLLSTVAVNLKDCSPFASVIDTNRPAADQTAFSQTLAAGSKAEGEGNFADAASLDEKAAGIEPDSAEAQFRWGACLLAQTNSPAAREHFERARDLDALPFRADSRINRIITETATRQAGPGLVFGDAVGLASSNSPAGIPGAEWFYEHVHLNCDGNYRLALAWAPQVARFLPASLTNGTAAHWASQAICERRLGLTDWNRISVLEDMLGRLSQPPFTAQSTHPAQMDALRAQVRQLRSSLSRPAADQAKRLYQEDLAAYPNDHRLHENFAEFLEMTGELEPAAAEWKRVTELIPQHHLAYFQSGRLLRRLGRLDEARSWMDKALALRPDLAEGWLELGNISALQGKPEEALREYARERALVPQDYRVYYHTGKALSKLHRGDEAMQNFRRALELRPNFWEARYALGEELAFAHQTAEAGREFAAVIREQPDYPLARLNLGVAMVQLGDFDGALLQFQEAQRLDPQNPTIADYIEKLRLARKRK